MVLSHFQINQIACYLAGLEFETFSGWNPPANCFDITQLDLCKNLYNLGLRFTEIQEFGRWSTDNNGLFYCYTAKGSNNREFTTEQLTTPFANAILSRSDIYSICRPDSFDIYINRNLSNFKIYAGQKPLTTHIFRHNKIRLLSDLGQTDSQIAAYLGEVSTANITRYMNQTIIH